MDVLDTFYFFLLGEGEGKSEAPGGEGMFFFVFNGKSQEGGGVPGGGGAEGPGGCLRQIGDLGGGGLSTINTKIVAIQKKILRGINFVKITKNSFQL